MAYDSHKNLIWAAFLGDQVWEVNRRSLCWKVFFPEPTQTDVKKTPHFLCFLDLLILKKHEDVGGWEEWKPGGREE